MSLVLTASCRIPYMNQRRRVFFNIVVGIVCLLFSMQSDVARASVFSCDKRAAYFVARAQTSELKSFLDPVRTDISADYPSERIMLTGAIARMSMAPVYLYRPSRVNVPVLALMASWNTTLLKSLGNIIGEWAHQSASSAVLLKSTALLHADTLRAFETAGEDPLLAGKMIGAYLQGVEAQHVLPVLERMGRADTHGQWAPFSSERSALENDLLSLKLAMESGNVLVVCTLTDFCVSSRKGPRFLRKLWSFQGGILFKADNRGNDGIQKDSSANNSSLEEKQSHASLHFQQFFDAGVDIALVTAHSNIRIQNTEFDPTQLRERARHILYSYCAAGMFDRRPMGGDHKTVSMPMDVLPAPFMGSFVEQSAILLQNDGNNLPLTAHGGKVILFYDAAFGQKAAMDVQSSLAQNMPDRKVQVELLPGKEKNHKHFSGENSIVFLGEENEKTIAAVQELQKQDVSITLILADDEIHSLSWASDIPVIIKAWSIAHMKNAAPSLVKLLTGKTDFSGHLPFSYPTAKDELQNMETPLAIGYKAYDQARKAPEFPFGYGLSLYGQSKFANFKVQSKSGQIIASFDVQNPTDITVNVVPQIYIDLPLALEEGIKKLGGWRKLSLKPHETAHMTFPLDKRFFSRWDENAHEWWIVPGIYGISLGTSAVSLTNHVMIRLQDTRFVAH